MFSILYDQQFFCHLWAISKCEFLSGLNEHVETQMDATFFLLAIWGSNSLIYQLYVKVGYTPSSYWQLGKSVFEKMQQLVACIFYTLSRIDPARDKAFCSFCFPEHEVFSQLASPGYNIYIYIICDSVIHGKTRSNGRWNSSERPAFIHCHVKPWNP